MKSFRRFATWALALCFTAATAQAAVEVTTSSGTVANSQAFPSLTFHFDEPYQFVGLSLWVDYDASVMTFDRTASALIVGSSSTPYPTVLETLQADPNVFADAVDSDGQHSLAVTFLSGSYPFPAGPVTLQAGFNLLPGFTSSDVRVYGTITRLVSDTPVEVLESTDFGTGDSPYLITVTAVPEPETWAMLLCGLGLLGAEARRRQMR